MHFGRGNQERLQGKKWAQVKLYFATAHREFRLTNQTAQQSGFHSANMMIEKGRKETSKKPSTQYPNWQQQHLPIAER
jgi:hypothetical protein